MTDSLLSRLQSLTGPDREVDAKIALAAGWTYSRLLPGAMEPCWRTPEGQIRPQPPRYTESLDAAKTLVPTDHWWNAGECKRENHASCGPEEGRGRAQHSSGRDSRIPMWPSATHAREALERLRAADIETGEGDAKHHQAND